MKRHYNGKSNRCKLIELIDDSLHKKSDKDYNFDSIISENNNKTKMNNQCKKCNAEFKHYSSARRHEKLIDDITVKQELQPILFLK